MSLVASYRAQLRDGIDFASLEKRLDRIADLGASHLYLAPILTAAPGSTHGYDVTDPTEIDPVLGGEDGFERLAKAAKAKGLSIILDMVPNHMAFGLDTPWLVDVLRHGEDSPHADVFDIDWSAGPLVLPWLQAPLAQMFEEGSVSLDGEGLSVGGMRVPLAPGTAPERLDAESLATLHDAQCWRLVPWQMERDSITHRRFFSVTSLIGVRVEDEAVFDKTHACILGLVERGLVDGLRVDHVDGLVDPGGYLRRLAAKVPDTPIWVEKILVTGETLPEWPVAGTTGYEAAAVIGRVLTDPDGFARIDALWRRETGIEGPFHDVVEAAKYEVLTDELAAELRQLRDFALAAAEAEGREYGPETLREALTELLVAFPRYRSYLGDGANDDDAALWRAVAEEAGGKVRSSEAIDWVVEAIVGFGTPQARRLAIRMQQVTGALLAKAHEDTAGFRFNRYLAVNEVGADPDLPLSSMDDVNAFLAERLARWPDALTLGSSHDTKRSEDARARLIAMTHDPGALAALWERASALPGSEAVAANRRFYALQVALCIWSEPEAEARLRDHLIKALREAKEITYWTAPDEAAETAVTDWAAALLEDWDRATPGALDRLVRIGTAISLRELALRCVLPGMPDIYQGGEAAILQLTDPDNRRLPSYERIDALPDGRGDLSDRKHRLLACLLDLRRAHPELFTEGTAEWSGGALHRRHGGLHLTVRFGYDSGEDMSEALWSDLDPVTRHGLAIRLDKS